MKKVLVILFSLFLLVGCDFNNNPKMATKEFFMKYQELDDAVLSDLELVVEGTALTLDNHKNEYTKAMKMQYSDLKYEIIEEEVDGDEASVEVKISVYDFYKVQKDALNYKQTHESEFLTDEVYDEAKFMTYKLKQMVNASDRVEYTIDVNLTKKDGKWVVKNFDKDTLDKIHGTYNYEKD